MFLGDIGVSSSAAIAYGFWSAAIHSSPYHRVALGGRTAEAMEHTVGDLASILSIVIRALSVLHARLAYYLGSKSPSRLRPYYQFLDYLDNLSPDERQLRIGILGLISVINCSRRPWDRRESLEVRGLAYSSEVQQRQPLHGAVWSNGAERVHVQRAADAMPALSSHRSRSTRTSRRRRSS